MIMLKAQIASAVALVFLVASAALFTTLKTFEANERAQEAQEAATTSGPPVTITGAEFLSYDGKVVDIIVTAHRNRNCSFEVSSQWATEDDVLVSQRGTSRVTLVSGEEKSFQLHLRKPAAILDPPFSVRSVAEYYCDNGIFVVPTPWIEVEKNGD